MKDFDMAKELFKDTINPKLYFDSMSAQIAKDKIEEAIGEQTTALIFVIGESGVGKSFIINMMHNLIAQTQLTTLLTHPCFDKRDLLKILYDSKGLTFDKNSNFNTLKDNLLNAYQNTKHTIFIDDAQLLNEEQCEFIRIMNNTEVFQFVLCINKQESTLVLEKKYFKAKTKIVIEYGNLEEREIYRYIQSILLFHNLGEIASMFLLSDAKVIGRYAQGNFRLVKQFLHTLMKLLSYAQKHGLSKYQKINSCLLSMAALDMGFINDKA